jgi:CheY-like chemotaxis protein
MTPKVLVVDDEPIVREILGRYLAKDGFEVELAEDGERAVATFVSTQPDIVLLDLMLPKLDGFQVFEQIRRVSDIPVIMLTAKTARARPHRGTRTGSRRLREQTVLAGRNRRSRTKGSRSPPIVHARSQVLVSSVHHVFVKLFIHADAPRQVP